MALSACLSLGRHISTRSSISNCKAFSYILNSDWNSPPQQQPVRHMSRIKRRHTVQPFWHAKVTRALYPENTTNENEEFLQEVVNDRYTDSESPLLLEPWVRGEWTSKSQRCGLIGKKIGVYPMWKKDGTKLMSTIIHISDNHVIRHVTAEELQKNDFKDVSRLAKRPRGVLLVGADSADPRLFTREYFKIFEQCGVMPKKKLTKFLISDNAVLQPGTPLYATHFRPGDRIDVAGYTLDYGFQGVIRRWRFKGGPKSHGNTKSHRRPGHIGCGGHKSKVMPGKKMPGHMGMEFRTLRGVQILRINSKYNCLWVNGRIPGAMGGYLNLYDSGLHHNRYRDPDNHPPFPTHYPNEQPVEHVDWWLDTVHPFTAPTIEFPSDGK